jgi:hypothetical protein
MLYSKTITIPANTPENNPFTLDFIIREKTITKIDVMMDVVATKGMVGVKIIIGKPDFRVYSFPADAEDWIRKSETWFGQINLPDANLPAHIIGISPNTVNDHLVIISIHTQ